jgi:outer membrane protein OmpU
MSSIKASVGTILFASILTGSAPAIAQSTVTIYGVLDIGMTYFSNIAGSSAWRQSSGVNNPSRWGITGKEDLGGGTNAVFRLEGGINLANGAFTSSGQEFNRVATVGLQNNSYGTVSLGRQPDFMIRLLSVTGIVGPIYAYHPGDYDRIAGEFLSNTVSYESPRWAGAHFGALYSFGSSTAPASNTGRGLSFLFDYQAEPLTVVAAMTDLNGVNINPAAIGLTRAFNEDLASTLAIGIKLDNLATYAAGVSYKIGAWRASGAYSRTYLRALSVTEMLQTGDFSLFYYVTPAFIVSANYARSVGLNGQWNVGTVMLDYVFSKRTHVYLETVYQRVGGEGQHAALLFQPPSSNASQLAVRVGMTHQF